MTIAPRSRSSVCVIAVLLAAGCSVANLTATVDTRTEPPPEPDYQKIVVAGVKANLKNASFGPLEISAIRRSAITQYGDWIVCVKGMRNDRPVYFGVSIKEHTIVRFEESAIIDRCEAEQYEPLPALAEPTIPTKEATPKPR
jgi:hypothetical protein